MAVPAFEKAIPGTGSLGFGALLLAAATAWAGPADDFQLGLAAYQAGDVVGAMPPLRRAADAGHGAAQALYGDILDKAELNEDAVRYLRMAAEQGNADGQYGLAVMYQAGEGVGQDLAEATRWFRAAAAQNHALAINALAQACIDGAQSCGTDGQTLVRHAADAGYLPALDAMAAAHRSGRFGFPLDTREADLWAARAAKLRGDQVQGRKGGK